MGMNSAMSAKSAAKKNGLRESALMKMYKDDRNYRADKLNWIGLYKESKFLRSLTEKIRSKAHLDDENVQRLKSSLDISEKLSYKEDIVWSS